MCGHVVHQSCSSEGCSGSAGAGAAAFATKLCFLDVEVPVGHAEEIVSVLPTALRMRGAYTDTDAGV